MRAQSSGVHLSVVQRLRSLFSPQVPDRSVDASDGAAHIGPRGFRVPLNRTPNELGKIRFVFAEEMPRNLPVQNRGGYIGVKQRSLPKTDGAIVVTRTRQRLLPAPVNVSIRSIIRSSFCNDRTAFNCETRRQDDIGRMLLTVQNDRAKVNDHHDRNV